MEIGTAICVQLEGYRFQCPCPWPSKEFPLGFEFFFDNLKIIKDETEPEDPYTLINPDGTHVAIFPNILKYAPYRIANIDQAPIWIPYKDCLRRLGMSHWSLTDVIDYHKQADIQEAILECVLARSYKVIRHFLKNGKLITKLETPE